MQKAQQSATMNCISRLRPGLLLLVLRSILPCERLSTRRYVTALNYSGITTRSAMSSESLLGMNDLVPAVDFSQSVQDASGQLGKRSGRIYKNDALRFAEWMQSQGLTVGALTRSHLIGYRSYLDTTYAKATAARMLSVARRILGEQVLAGNITANPAKEVKGFSLDNESPHISLKKEQARELLASIDTSTPAGKRDYALISLLLRTGIRRSECVALNISDFTQEQGHTVATVRHGKGDKRRKVKVPVDVQRHIKAYLDTRSITSVDEPLFVHSSTRWRGHRITDKYIERLVHKYGQKIGIELTPHDLRASFITLAIEGKATLLQVQYAAGHSDPRTTERYHIRKLNLDDNAVDYIKL
jgi:integrase/recombinase XerD